MLAVAVSGGCGWSCDTVRPVSRLIPSRAAAYPLRALISCRLPVSLPPPLPFLTHSVRSAFVRLSSSGSLPVAIAITRLASSHRPTVLIASRPVSSTRRAGSGACFHVVPFLSARRGMVFCSRFSSALASHPACPPRRPMPINTGGRLRLSPLTAGVAEVLVLVGSVINPPVPLPALRHDKRGGHRLFLLGVVILFRSVVRCHRLPLRRASSCPVLACPCDAFRVRTP